MTIERVLMLVGCLLAVALLAKLMRRRREHLVMLLRQYVQNQPQSARQARRTSSNARQVTSGESGSSANETATAPKP